MKVTVTVTPSLSPPGPCKFQHCGIFSKIPPADSMIQATTQEMADTCRIGSSAFVHGGGDPAAQSAEHIGLFSHGVQRNNKSSLINQGSIFLPGKHVYT